MEGGLQRRGAGACLRPFSELGRQMACGSGRTGAVQVSVWILRWTFGIAYRLGTARAVIGAWDVDRADMLRGERRCQEGGLRQH